MAATDPLDRRVVEQMLVGVATRRYARSLEPLGPEVTSRGTSKSAVSRRFVARTRAQLETWQAAPLEHLDLVALLLDGVHVGEHCLIVARGIARGRRQTRAGPLRGLDGECDGLSVVVVGISTVGACGQTAACW
jgi:hypothetical protein